MEYKNLKYQRKYCELVNSELVDSDAYKNGNKVSINDFFKENLSEGYATLFSISYTAGGNGYNHAMIALNNYGNSRYFDPQNNRYFEKLEDLELAKTADMITYFVYNNEKQISIANISAPLEFNVYSP